MAGIEIAGGRYAGWVRPVSKREWGEVSEYERQYEDGSHPQMLDVVCVPVLKPAPNGFQTENWLLNDRAWWEREGAVGVDALADMENRQGLWRSDAPDTRHGLNDRITVGAAAALTNSLRLIHVDDLRLRVFAPGADFGNLKRRVQASFMHRGSAYRLFVTDPRVEAEYLAFPDEFHDLGAAYLTVSLGEPYDGHVYKLVAAVIPG